MLYATRISCTYHSLVVALPFPVSRKVKRFVFPLFLLVSLALCLPPACCCPKGTTKVENLLDSEDIQFMLGALKTLKVKVTNNSSTYLSYFVPPHLRGVSLMFMRLRNFGGPLDNSGESSPPRADSVHT